MDQQLSTRHPLKRKPLNSKQSNKLNRKRNSQTTSPPFQLYSSLNEDKRILIQLREAEKNIGLKLNQQNISLIAKKQEISFISNRQDHSLDSFDKMIIGVDEQLYIEDENTSNSKEQEPNYSMLYHQFERLIKKNSANKSSLSEMEIQNDNVLQAEIFQGEDDKGKESSYQLHAKSATMPVIDKQKIEQLKQIKKYRTNLNQTTVSDPNISLRLVGANLSEIHQQEIQHNSSMNRMDPIEQQFIDFVSKNNQVSKINISKIQKNNEVVKQQKKVKFKHQINLNNSLKQPQQDQVVAMLQNQLGSRRQNMVEQQSILQQQISETKKKAKNYEKQNYNQILRELDQNQDKKFDNSNIAHNISQILAKREEWITNRNDKTLKWKNHQLQLLTKIKQIMVNPLIQFSDEQEFNLEI